MHASAIVVAAGRSERFGGAVPKVLAPWRGRPVLAWTLEAIDASEHVRDVILVASETVEAGWRACGSPGSKVRAVVRGGGSRQESVAAGLRAIPPGCDVVLVHDGARPHASPGLFDRVAEAASRHGAAVPTVSVTDTVKVLAHDDLHVEATMPRERLRRAQTPQGIRLDVFVAARRHAEATGVIATDDVGLVEAAMTAGALGLHVEIVSVPGEEANVKITRADDLPRAASIRAGLGHDVHPLSPGRAFALGGVDLMEGVPAAERFGPVGHSDGDALCHAICDALLGAAALGDIGQAYPDTDATHAGRSSLEFCAGVATLLRDAGWRIVNVSAVVRLERPAIAPVSARMRAALASALGIDVDRVGVSAKRGEGLGDIGAGRAVACDVVALVERT